MTRIRIERRGLFVYPMLVDELGAYPLRPCLTAWGARRVAARELDRERAWAAHIDARIEAVAARAARNAMLQFQRGIPRW